MFNPSGITEYNSDGEVDVALLHETVSFVLEIKPELESDS